MVESLSVLNLHERTVHAARAILRRKALIVAACPQNGGLE